MSITLSVSSRNKRGLLKSSAVGLMGVICFVSCTNKEDAVVDKSDEGAETEQVEEASPNKIEWTEFSTHRVANTIAGDRCAIIYIGYPFSIFLCDSFEKVLGAPFAEADYYRFEADWTNPSNSPFYSEFGVPKDGSIVVQLPNGNRRIFKFSDKIRGDALKFIDSSSRKTHE